jgi:localization factor PodJL
MSSAQPWSVRGLDPKAREIAKDLAYQAGLSLGDWLHQILREEGLSAQTYSPAPYVNPNYPPTGYGPGPSPGYGQGHFGPTPRELADQAERVALRLAAVENRAGLGEQSLTEIGDKISQNQAQMGDRLASFELALQGLRADQVKLRHQLQSLGSDPTATRALTGLRALEGAMSKVVVLMRRDQGQSQSALSQIHDKLGLVNDRVDQVESLAQSGHALAEQSHIVNSTLAEKLEQAEANQIAARARLEQAIGQLQDRIRLVQAEGKAEVAQASAGVAQRLGVLSQEAQAQMQTVRCEVGEIVAAEVGQRFDAVNATLDQVGQQVRSSDQRTGEALLAMGSEITRLGTSMDQRLTLADRNRTQAIDRLKSEVFRVIERISERLSHSERRAQQASEDVGAQVARAVDHISERADRSSNDLVDRVRQSEDRIAYLLDEARARLDRHLTQEHGKTPRKAQTSDAPPALATDPFSSIRPEWQDLTAPMTTDPTEAFDANDFVFNVQQVESTFTNGFDEDADLDVPKALDSETPMQDTWSASWTKAVL